MALKCKATGRRKVGRPRNDGKIREDEQPYVAHTNGDDGHEAAIHRKNINLLTAVFVINSIHLRFVKTCSLTVRIINQYSTPVYACLKTFGSIKFNLKFCKLKPTNIIFTPL